MDGCTLRSNVIFLVMHGVLCAEIVGATSSEGFPVNRGLCRVANGFDWYTEDKRRFPSDAR